MEAKGGGEREKDTKSKSQRMNGNRGGRGKGNGMGSELLGRVEPFWLHFVSKREDSCSILSSVLVEN